MRNENKLSKLSKTNLILIGFMATGKSTIGKILAEELTLKFVDLDEEIIKKAGMNIPDIFVRYGEKYFRDMEKETLKEILQLDGQVVATGGGVVEKRTNIKLMQQNGVLICLKAHPKVIMRRANQNEDRPLLAVNNPEKKIQKLLMKRKSAYNQADIFVDTSKLSPQETVEQIIEVLSSHNDL